MALTFVFLIFGYFSGSILFAKTAEKLFKKDVTDKSNDSNPGAANAFVYGGFWVGVLTLTGDMLKGFLPVFLYLKLNGSITSGTALVLAAPVLGHIFSVFYHFKGGKGIATSFGSLLGLAPDLRAALTLAVIYIFLSVAVVVSPNVYRTITAYGLFSASSFFLLPQIGVRVGVLIISILIIIKHILCDEDKKKLTVAVPVLRILEK